MSETFPSKPGTSRQSVLEKIGWTVLIAATLFVCYFSHLGAIGFVGPDEPRYAWIARDMAETGDWVTPRLYGKPWFEKPPLFYWGAAICFKLFGVSEAAARLPSAICALLATLAMAWLAWRMYGTETARWLLLLLPTTVGMIGFSHAAATDMPFTAMLTIAMVCAAVVLRLVPDETGGASPAPTRGIAAPSTAVVTDTSGNVSAASAALSPASPSQTTSPVDSTPWLALVLFGIFLGLAVLAKGPAAIILCGGAVFFWALFTKRWRDAFRLLHPAAVVAFCATALPWYLLCARRNPDFLRVFIMEHNFRRYLTPEFQHIQPFWFYVPILLSALLPWAFLFLWHTLLRTLALWRTHRIIDFNWLLLWWFGFTILFFSVSQSKLPGYILPSLPPVALFTAQGLRNHAGRLSPSRWFFSLAGSTLILLGILADHFADKVPFVTDIRPSPAVGQFAFFATLGGILAVALAVFRRSTTSSLVAVTTVLALMTLDVRDLWELDDGVSARRAVKTVEQIAPRQVAAATVFKLRRAYKYQLDFYLHRETQEWSPATEKHSIVFTEYKNSAELIRLGGWCPHYFAFPAVLVCKGSKDDPDLMRSAGSNGRSQPQ